MVLGKVFISKYATHKTGGVPENLFDKFLPVFCLNLLNDIKCHLESTYGYICFLKANFHFKLFRHSDVDNVKFQVTYFKDSSNENDDNQTLKLSQLRQLLVKNLKSPTSAFKPKTSTW